MELLTPKQVTSILKSIEKVFEKKDSSLLTKAAYNFIMLSSGFIAHYNIFGFSDYYSDVNQLAQEIVDNRRFNRWSNFRPGEKDYDYYMQKASIYKQIVILAENHLNKN